MKSFKKRLNILETKIKDDDITVMIIGLGSVGTYLLNYLINRNDPAIRIVAVGRDFSKMESKVNISRIAGLIRNENKSEIMIEGGVDLNEVSQIRAAIEQGIFNELDLFRNRNLFERRAVCKCAVVNILKTFGERDCLQRFAVLECIGANDLHAFRNGNGFQICAFITERDRNGL